MQSLLHDQDKIDAGAEKKAIEIAKKMIANAMSIDSIVKYFRGS